jgi:PAS domain S-box-containing protein
VEQGRERDINGALLDTIATIVCVIDAEGRIVRFNRASERLSGYSIAEVLDRPFWEVLVPPDEAAQVKDLVRLLAERRLSNEWESHWITKCGARRLIHWSNTVVCDGDRLAWIIGTGTDITERRQAEEQCDRLLEKERTAHASAEKAVRRAAFLGDLGPVLGRGPHDEAGMAGALARHVVPFLADWCLIRLVDDDGSLRRTAFVHDDPAVELAFRRLEPLGSPAAVDPLLQAAGPIVINGITVCVPWIEGQYSTYPSVWRAGFRTRLRMAGLTSLMAVPIRRLDQQMGSILLARTTERSVYGPEDVALADALVMGAALALDNLRLVREAQRAQKAREDFLMAASHELRTPLTSLHVAVEALLMHARAESAAGRRPWGMPLLETIRHGSLRLGGLVEDILDISGLSAGTPAPALTAVDFEAVVADAVGASEDVLRRAGCEARVSVRAPASGRWDRRWLVRIVMQILANAAKYGAGRPIEIDLEGDNETARLTVRDRGIGIPADEQARIFERFERAVPLRHYGGLGLGLWFVRRMVEALDGHIRVESSPGDGATFIVELPTAGPEPPPAGPRQG